MFKHYGHCLYCQTNVEHEKKREGTYNQWVIENVKKNFEKWKEEKRQRFSLWLEEVDSKNYITEAGQIEDWSNMSESAKKDVVGRFENHIADEEEKMNKLINEETI